MQPKIKTAVIFWILFCSSANAAFNSFQAHNEAVINQTIASYGAVCDGSTDDTTAFLAFRTWAIANQGTSQIILSYPSGQTCCVSSTGSNAKIVNGVKNLIVEGNNSTLSSICPGASGFFTLGGDGQLNNNLHSTRVASVSAGASSITVAPASASQPAACNSNATCTALFTVGQYALLTGIDLQAGGFPSNPFYFEYVKILSVNSSTGVVTFTAPIKYSYLSTWPSYDSGTGSTVDQGGPATLYALDPSWDTQVEYRNLTITQTGQTNAGGRSATFSNVTFSGTACGIPSQNLLWQVINSDLSGCTAATEFDKLVTEGVFDNSTIYKIFMQSSNDTLTIKNGTVITNSLSGTARFTNISDSNLTAFNVGTVGQGRTDQVTCTNCVFGSIASIAIVEKGQAGDPGLVAAGVTMSGGVITWPSNTLGAPKWAIPGTNLMWNGAHPSESNIGTAFQITGVTQSGSNVLIATTLSTGFPTVPLASGSRLFLMVHPAPKFTCTGCSGSVAAIDLAGAPANAPLFSYSSRVFTGYNDDDNSGYHLWGNLSTVTFNETQAWTGSALTLNFSLPVVNSSSSTTVFYTPAINAKQTGSRVITLSSVTCDGTGGSGCSGDSGLAAPDSSVSWFAEDVGFFFSTDISGTCPRGSPGAGCPSITATFQTNQGVVNP